MPSVIGAPQGEYDPSSVFWQHELLHREILKDYFTRMGFVKDDIETLQTNILNETNQISNAAKPEREELVRRSFEASLELDKRLYEKVRDLPQKKSNGYSLYPGLERIQSGS